MVLSTRRTDPTVWLDAPPFAMSTPTPQLLMESPDRVHALSDLLAPTWNFEAKKTHQFQFMKTAV